MSSSLDLLSLRADVLARGGAISTSQIAALLAAGPSDLLPAVLGVIDPALVYCDTDTDPGVDESTGDAVIDERRERYKSDVAAAQMRTAVDGGRLLLVQLAERQSGWVQGLADEFASAYATAATNGPTVAGGDPFGTTRASVVDQVALACGLTGASADEWLGAAMLLAPGGLLADTHAQVRAGRVTRGVARATAEMLWQLEPEQITRVQAKALPRFTRHVDAVTGHGCPITVTQARRILRTWISRIAPEHESRKRAQAHTDRAVTYRELPDGMCQITAYLPTLEAAIAWRSLQALGDTEHAKDRAAAANGGHPHTCHSESDKSQEGSTCHSESDKSQEGSTCHSESDKCSEESTCHSESDMSGGVAQCHCESDMSVRTLAQCRADALVAALQTTAQHVADGGELPSHHGRMRLSIGVHMTVDQLLALRSGACEIPGIGALDPELARILAHDQAWQQFIHQPLTGELLDAGADTYSPTRPLRDFLIARDPVCTFPGCHQPAHRSQLDHITPWPDGKTTRANLHLLCVHHHNLKTHADWAVRRDPDTGDTHWTTPHGLTATNTAPHADLFETDDDQPPF